MLKIGDLGGHLAFGRGRVDGFGIGDCCIGGGLVDRFIILNLLGVCVRVQGYLVQHTGQLAGRGRLFVHLLYHQLMIPNQIYLQED